MKVYGKERPYRAGWNTQAACHWHGYEDEQVHGMDSVLAG